MVSQVRMRLSLTAHFVDSLLERARFSVTAHIGEKNALRVPWPIEQESENAKVFHGQR